MEDSSMTDTYPLAGLVGKRIKLVEMKDEINPVPVGTEGIVVIVNRFCIGSDVFHQLIVKWDNGSSLALAIPPDRYEVLP
jgi:hypothetical protein